MMLRLLILAAIAAAASPALAQTSQATPEVVERLNRLLTRPGPVLQAAPGQAAPLGVAAPAASGPSSEVGPIGRSLVVPGLVVTPPAGNGLVGGTSNLSTGFGGPSTAP